MDSFADEALFARHHDGFECHSDRASDYYGLGIRLGIYFAWLNAYLANILLPSSIGSAADTNAVFLLTLFIAAGKDSMRGHLAEVDALVLLHLSMGTVFGILTIWGYRTRLYMDKGPSAVGMFGSYGTHVRMLLSFAVNVYNLWFWGWGVDGWLRVLGPDDGMEGNDEPNPEECSQLWTFFFANVKANAGIRFYYIALSVGCLIYFGAMVISSVFGLWFAVERLLGRLHERWAHTAHANSMVRPRYVTGFTSTELGWIYKVMRIWNPIWLVFSMLTVECTLNFNHLQGVLGGPDNTLSTPGQLLPFLVGAFGFVQTVYAILKQRVFQKEEHKEGDHTAFNQRDFGPNVLRSTFQLDLQQEGRSRVVRYLVGWLPWLSLLQTFDSELSVQGISRANTGMTADSMPMSPGSAMHVRHVYARAPPSDSALSPATPGYPYSPSNYAEYKSP